MWIIIATDLCLAQISRRVSRKKTQNNILIFHESALFLAAAFTSAVTLVLLWVCMLSHCCYVWLFETPWTVAHQAPLSKGFSRQGYWSWLPFPSPGDLPNPGTKPASFICLLPGKLALYYYCRLVLLILWCLKPQFSFLFPQGWVLIYTHVLSSVVWFANTCFSSSGSWVFLTLLQGHVFLQESHLYWYKSSTWTKNS